MQSAVNMSEEGTEYKLKPCRRSANAYSTNAPAVEKFTKKAL